MKIFSPLVFACALAQAGTKKMTVEDSLAIHRVASPKFSPDGNWILYAETEWDRKNDRQVSHIWLARASGGSAPVKFTAGEKGETAPQWAPDGSHIAFLADRGAADSKSGNQIWLIRPDGGEAEKLTSEDTAITEYQWAPNGKRIAYITADTPKDKADREKRKKDKFDAILVDADYNYSHLWIVDADGKNKKRVTEGRLLRLHAALVARFQVDRLRSVEHGQTGKLVLRPQCRPQLRHLCSQRRRRFAEAPHLESRARFQPAMVARRFGDHLPQRHGPADPGRKKSTSL